MLASRMARANIIRSETPLSDQQIMEFAPSVFSEEPHFSRSDRYAYVSTIEVLNALRAEGFQPFMACQSIPRKVDKHLFTKHMLRLRHENYLSVDTGEANEIILLNSHDGTSSYQMLSGMFRFVCCNGLVCGDIVGDFRVRHSGEDIIDDVIEGAYSVLDSFDEVADSRQYMIDTPLSEEEQLVFAQAAAQLKWDDKEPPVSNRQILLPRRDDDRQNNVWSVYNRVQENLIKGGLHGHTVGTNGRQRRTTTRPVKGIDGDVKLNRALWVLAEEYAKLKRAA